jgi:phospholipid/cholesterol/gamma-HCH transport system permease protein
MALWGDSRSHELRSGVFGEFCCGCLLDAAQTSRYASGDSAQAAHSGRYASPKMSEATATSSLPAVLGEVVKRQVASVQDYTLLTLQSLMCMFSPPYYWFDTLEQMDVVGVGSLPIIIVAGLSIGGVLVLQTAAQFQRFGSTALTGDAVSLALVRELAPAVTALLVAGRNASGMASELGSMVVTEQVDAMRALGTDPVRKLMMPRVIATVLMVPLLTAVFDFVGLCGGFLVAYTTLRLGAVQFWTRAINALAIGDVVQGLTKPFAFGMIIATVGCYRGLRVRGGTQGVGRATTSAVVISSVCVLVVDFFLSRLLLYLFQ